MESTKWKASFHITTLDLPAFGRMPMGYECTVSAPTREVAIERATEEALEFDKRARFNHIMPLHYYAVKFRGKDKRKREEFVVLAENEEVARRRAPRINGVYRFAGYKPEIVGVRRV